MTVWTQIEIVHEGKPYRGRYKVEDGMFTVDCSLGRKTTQVGGSGGNDVLPRIMLSEIVRAGHGD